MSAKIFGTWEEAVSWLVEQPDQHELVKACYYDLPLNNAAERYWKSPEWQAIRELLPSKSDRALDVGAGNGIASYALAKDGWDVTALEPDPSDRIGAGAIRTLAQETGLTISVAEEFGEKLPFKDATFDLVHARQVLHHAHDLEKFCSELARVLKPGGTLIATREHVISSQAQLPEFLDNHPLHKLYGGENALLLKQYKSALYKAGFSIKASPGPLESVINYAPFTEVSLCQEICERASAVPGGRFLMASFLATPWRRFTLKILSLLDNRPGRLYTFVCRRGMGSE